MSLNDSFPQLPSDASMVMEPIEQSRGKKSTQTSKGRPTLSDVLKVADTMKVRPRAGFGKVKKTPQRGSSQLRKSARLSKMRKADKKLEGVSTAKPADPEEMETDTQLPTEAGSSQPQLTSEDLEQRDATERSPPTEQEITAAEASLVQSTEEQEDVVDCGPDPVRRLKHPGLPLPANETRPPIVPAEDSLLAEPNSDDEESNWETVQPWAESLYHVTELLYYFLLGSTNRALNDDNTKLRSLYHFISSFVPSLVSMYDPQDTQISRTVLKGVHLDLLDPSLQDSQLLHQKTSSMLRFVGAFMGRYLERILYQKPEDQTSDSKNTLQNSLLPLVDEDEVSPLMASLEAVFNKNLLEKSLSESLRNLICFHLQRLFRVLSPELLKQLLTNMPPNLQLFTRVNHILTNRKEPAPTTITWSTLPHHLEYRRQFYSWTADNQAANEPGDGLIINSFDEPPCKIPVASRCEIYTLRSLEFYDLMSGNIQRIRQEEREREEREREEQRLQAERLATEQAEKEKELEKERISRELEEQKKMETTQQKTLQDAAQGQSTVLPESQPHYSPTSSNYPHTPSTAFSDHGTVHPAPGDSEMDILSNHGSLGPGHHDISLDENDEIDVEGLQNNPASSTSAQPIHCYLVIIQGTHAETIRLPNSVGFAEAAGVLQHFRPNTAYPMQAATSVQASASTLYREQQSGAPPMTYIPPVPSDNTVQGDSQAEFEDPPAVNLERIGVEPVNFLQLLHDETTAMVTTLLQPTGEPSGNNVGHVFPVDLPPRVWGRYSDTTDYQLIYFNELDKSKVRVEYRTTPSDETASIRLALITATQLLPSPATSVEKHKCRVVAFQEYFKTVGDSPQAQLPADLAKKIKGARVVGGYSSWLHHFKTDLPNYENRNPDEPTPLPYLSQPDLFDKAYHDHVTMVAPFSRTDLTKAPVILGKLLKDEAIATLQAKMDFYYFQNRQTRFKAALCNDIALQAIPSTWCRSEPSADRASWRQPICSSIRCVTAGPCLLRHSTVVAGLTESILPVLHSIADRLYHVAKHGRHRLLVESLDDFDLAYKMEQSLSLLGESLFDSHTFVAPTHPQLVNHGQAPSNLVVGQSLHFGTLGEYLRVHFPAPLKSENSEFHSRYLQQYGQIMSLLSCLGFRVVSQPSSGDLFVLMTDVTASHCARLMSYFTEISRLEKKYCDNSFTREESNLPKLSVDSALPACLCSTEYPSIVLRPDTHPSLQEVCHTAFHSFLRSVRRDPQYGFNSELYSNLRRARTFYTLHDNPTDLGLFHEDRQKYLDKLVHYFHTPGCSEVALETILFPLEPNKTFHNTCQHRFCFMRCHANQAGYRRMLTVLSSQRTLEKTDDRFRGLSAKYLTILNNPVEPERTGQTSANCVIGLELPTTYLDRLFKDMGSPFYHESKHVAAQMEPTPLLKAFLKYGWSLTELSRLGTIYGRRVLGVFLRQSKSNKRRNTHPRVPLLNSHFFPMTPDSSPMLLSPRQSHPVGLDVKYLSLLESVKIPAARK
ncbi:Oidioi.mRNA.OKI2018_I69.chr1.g3838.t1.cds [Oikopleura dioica]|uniref:Oidioi.mRNA.OKI2018_I69.chr1.g3838.t1.cds n=1 Tax=Oikopleura dioica TaxID=34765 RepID=A0ABN7SVX6_OIKDI|nr:Oidioi.mRNA.OKI2018_I69.chr1.g3838.t1.cds [Oikopleura dioica]